ncbi:hypothetical protein CP965_08280 [Halarcobacter mediterraneus]|uniref:DUF3373 domain-containing protein n=1 Tax=Halarcobacter mediterraneus TaxID=2023153 RepID=A0A4Q1ATN4_9BACT|nr:DUF3373 family protein [Halarcobacter mediterraneus]RXK12567.1 hypothetical protein CP965_08280 [Halarcobacter mediterraneus]
MKKSMIALSVVAAFATSSFANAISNEEMLKQINALKAQITALENKLTQTQNTSKENKVSLENMMKSETIKVDDTRFKKLEKKVARNQKTIKDVKIHDSNDNIKWDIDFRTQIDNLQYKFTDGTKKKNNSLMTNRLWLGMGYSPNENTIFKGKLSYLKAYGDSANHSQANVQPGYANFDWVTNENATDNSLKVKEAYWLYMNDTFLDTKVPWTFSVGRRPSTDGLGINLRENMTPNSPLSHTVNVEFDGFSSKFTLDKVTDIPGMWLKFCAGRGLTNATPRFSADGADYVKDDNETSDMDMFGFIFVPYDDGQYSIHTNYARAWNMIGFTQADMFDGDNTNNNFKDFGDMDLATVMFKAYGIGDGISDYLDDTTFFASYAMSRTHPKENMSMLGSTDSQTGHSFWLGVNAPCPISPDTSRIGIEWNKGSKYWRSMTYGEDTMAGSKIAARGTAWEIYRHQKINDALSFELSFTRIDYDYYGSNGFFGFDGNPDLNMPYVKTAEDLKASIRYKF